MNNLILYIDDIPMDLGGGTVVGITKQVNDIAEMKDRKADYSNQFKLPATINNRKVIDGAQIMPSTTRAQYRKLPAKLVLSGIETLGYIVINGSTENYFECVFYSGNLNFFELIKGKKISDLDLSSAEHAWTLANVSASRTNTWDSGGYIYPIIDTVNNGTHISVANPRLDWRFLTPWLFVKFIFNKIFSEVNFVAEGKFLESERFKKAITNLETNLYSQAQEQYKLIVGLSYAYPDLNPNGLLVRFSSVIADSAGQNAVIPNQTTNTNAFNPNQNGVFRFAFSLVFTYANTNLQDLDKIEIAIYDLAGVYLRTEKTWNKNIDFVISASNVFTITDSGDVTVAATEAACVRIVWSAIIPPAVIIMDSSSYFNLIYSTKDLTIPMAVNDVWKIQENLYDMEQTEFIKTICQRFCLIPDTNPYLNKVKFYQFGEVIDNIPRARDWSEKIAQNNKITFRDNSYGQRNWMRYEQSDEQPELPEYGDWYFDINDEVLQKEKDTLTLKFKSTKRVNRLVGRLIPHVEIFDDAAPIVGKFDNNAGARLLILDTNTGTAPIQLIELPSTTPLVTYTTNIPMAYFKNDTVNDLDWQSGIKTDYYDFIRVLQLYKNTNELLHLTAADVLDFDFSIPVYIQKYGSHFYVNKISNWINGKPTTVELIKIN